jgi:hypothetical protein
MRVLISTRQGAGHFGPLVPFAHALLRDGAEVLVPDDEANEAILQKFRY